MSEKKKCHEENSDETIIGWTQVELVDNHLVVHIVS